MHGLDSSTDVSFLLGCSLDDLERGEHVLLLRFSNRVEITAECSLDVGGTHYETAIDAYESLLPLVGRRIAEASVRSPGDLVLEWSLRPERIVFRDSNASFESYTVSWSDGTLVV